MQHSSHTSVKGRTDSATLPPQDAPKTLEELEKQDVIARVEEPVDWVNNLVIVTHIVLTFCTSNTLVKLHTRLQTEHFYLQTSLSLTTNINILYSIYYIFS